MHFNLREEINVGLISNSRHRTNQPATNAVTMQNPLPRGST